MKVALVCDSPLLKKSLELYLKESVSSYAECDFVISDKTVKSKKPVLFIGKRKDATLCVPFSKEEMLSKAQQFYIRHAVDPRSMHEDEIALEKVLVKLHKKHRVKIEKILKEFRDEA